VRHCVFLALALSAVVGAEVITPRVGIVEVYGARKVSVQKIKSAVGVKPGDPLPSRADAEDRIDKIAGILTARVEATCCDQRSAVLYVGVAERDEPHFEFRPTPTGSVALSPEIVSNYHAFLDAVADSLRGHNADEDLTNGYSLMADPECRRLQQTFLASAATDLPQINQVLRESADTEQRIMAAYLLQYGPRGPRTSKVVAEGLQYALQDREDTVRQTALRSLQAVAVGSKLHSEQQIYIQPTWFIELMNSVVWSDRRGASLALVNLTDTHDADTLSLLRERALASVLEMARWHDLQHALPAFILAGRLAGLEEKEIQAAWVSGDRDPVLKQALNPKKKPHRQPKQLG
jgi:hypothetical protein